MLTYNNGTERVAVTNKKDIKRWYEINRELIDIEDPDIFEELLDLIGTYFWERTRQSAISLNSFLKRNKIHATAKEVTFLWEPIEEI